MKLFRPKTLALFGIGFLAGSRAGHGPWEKAQAGMDQMKQKFSGSMGSGSGSSTSSNGVDGHWSKKDPQLTEM
ncbi:MAG TPA: hypothetical protein VKX24_07800 [Acidimicrobiia bacterium]|nr:hypothetical protein [Acidimicrobiia bacterium]HZQ75850.1 hypothetical protein [Acidimicrobiia bacterium]